MTSRAFSSLLLVAALLGPALADAQQGEAAGWGYSLAHELMSPFCPGRTLAQCTSPQAQELRQWILMQEAAGATRAEVRANLLERYGDAIRSAPKPEGWGLSAYLLPLVFFLGGGGLVVIFLRPRSCNQSSRGRSASVIAVTIPPTNCLSNKTERGSRLAHTPEASARARRGIRRDFWRRRTPASRPR